jgi:CelD/BcsL family acetyltransferase involved in cellulose biosynthesis
VLCDPSCQEDVSRVLADWLVEANRANGVNSWDMLHLDGVENGDPALQGLLGQLTQRGCTLHRQPGMNCWRIPLPSTWEAYLKQLPKPQRKRMRDARKSLSDPGEFQVACVADTRGWERAWSRFVELHQRRRTSLGQPGCFTDTAFGAFLQDAAAELMRAGVARLVLVERGDQAIGALLTFTGATTCYAYQMGTNPDCLADSPGWLLVCAALQAGLERHESALDLLRGDEPYKGRMGGVPRSMLQVRVVPPQLGAQLRHSAWLTGSALKSWIKAGLRTAGFSKTGPSSTWSTST